MNRNNFSDLYDASRKDLYKYCRNLCGDDADDLLQQTYLKAWENFDKFDGRNFPSWLCSVARNIFLDNLRKSKHEFIEELPEIPDSEDNNPVYIAENRERSKILMNKINNCLNPLQRLTVIFYYYDEKSVSEIADIMQCSENTVKSRLFNARKKLRKALKNDIFSFGWLAVLSMKRRLKNIKISVNARITASAVLTVTAMTAVSMTNINNTENKLPKEVIILESTSDTTAESTEKPSIKPTSHTTTKPVYYTTPTEERLTMAFKGEFEEITLKEDDTEPEEEPTENQETQTETEEETTMKKEIITVAAAATMAVSGITATITTAIDETETTTELFSAETSTETTTTTEIEITTDLDKGVSKVTVFIRQKPDKTIYSIGEELDLTGGLYDVYEVVSFDYGGEMNADMWYNEMTDGSKRTDGFSPIYTDIDTSEFDSTKAGTYRINITATNLNTLDSYTKYFEVTVTDDSETQETETDSNISGDANSDFRVSISDSVKILQNIANSEKYTLTEQETINADCYDPGSGVTGLDAAAIQKFDAGIIDKLPETLS